MKYRINPFLRSAALAPMVALVASPFVLAADIDTTGSTIESPVLLAIGNNYSGNGFLTAAGAPGTEFGIGDWSTNFHLTSGGLFTIQSGVRVWTPSADWTGNLADLQLDGTLDVWDNPAETRVDALNGAGSITYGSPWNDRMWVHVGLDGGSGTFSGTAQGPHWTGNGIQMRKSGAGTQTFDNLANQPFKNLTINAGVVDLKNATDVTVGYPISGAGNLTKSGAGVLTLTGSITTTGNFTVSEGTVKVGANLTPNVNVVIASGALMDLTGVSTVNSLEIAGSGALPAGTYDSTHATYGSYFTGVGFGTGALKILPPTGPNDGIWSLEENGDWSDFAKWESSTVASAAGKIATFKAISPVTVTVDINRTIGQLVFDEADHTLASGFETILTLDNAPAAPSVTVALDKQARITVVLASTTGLVKNGDGTLTLASTSNIAGGTVINGGRLVLENCTSGGPSFTVGTGTTLELAFLSGGGRNISNGTITGGGNLVKTGGSLASFGNNGQTQVLSLEASSLIDVQAGVLRNEWGAANWSANLADLNVEGGAYFDIWDADVSVDAITGGGVINKGWSGTHTFTFGVAGGGGSFSGTISSNAQNYGGNGDGTFNLVKTGAGTQAFTGTTTFNGALTVQAGVLSLGNGSTSTNLSDTIPVTVATDAKLHLNFTGSDVVASVTLGDTAYTAPGAYGAANYPDFFTGSGTLLIGTDYDIWAINQGVTGGPNDDDDNDGLTNNDEYAFGLLPTSSSSVNPITVPLNKTTGTLSYTRRTQSLTDLTYTVRSSSTLEQNSWTALVKDTDYTESVSTSGEVETVTITLTPAPTADKLFLQVSAE